MSDEQQPNEQQRLDGEGDDEGGDEQSPSPAEELTPEKFAALQAEAVAQRRKTKAAQQVADELRAEVERHRQQSESEQEKAVREAVEAERERLTAEFASERLQNRLRARAAGRLADPDDAVLHLSVSLEPSADDEALDAAISDLLEHKAYLATAGTANGGEQSLVTQGARSTPPGRTEQSPDAWIRARGRNR